MVGGKVEARVVSSDQSQSRAVWGGVVDGVQFHGFRKLYGFAMAPWVSWSTHQSPLLVLRCFMVYICIHSILETFCCRSYFCLRIIVIHMVTQSMLSLSVEESAFRIGGCMMRTYDCLQTAWDVHRAPWDWKTTDHHHTEATVECGPYLRSHLISSAVQHVVVRLGMVHLIYCPMKGVSVFAWCNNFWWTWNCLKIYNCR